ncbi:MAG: hypothetical protein FRX49_01683 [Trebouxia sp. A1-2]|nr:MAG: hypothetical protein FRX49_01683 [Trebouxia sp. A1-2]
MPFACFVGGTTMLGFLRSSMDCVWGRTHSHVLLPLYVPWGCALTPLPQLTSLVSIHLTLLLLTKSGAKALWLPGSRSSASLLVPSTTQLGTISCFPPFVLVLFGHRWRKLMPMWTLPGLSLTLRAMAGGRIGATLGEGALGSGTEKVGYQTWCESVHVRGCASAAATLTGLNACSRLQGLSADCWPNSKAVTTAATAHHRPASDMPKLSPLKLQQVLSRLGALAHQSSAQQVLPWLGAFAQQSSAADNAAVAAWIPAVAFAIILTTASGNTAVPADDCPAKADKATVAAVAVTTGFTEATAPGMFEETVADLMALADDSEAVIEVGAAAVTAAVAAVVVVVPHLQQAEGQRSGLGGYLAHGVMRKRLTGSYPSLMRALTTLPFPSMLDQPAHDIHDPSNHACHHPPILAANPHQTEQDQTERLLTPPSRPMSCAAALAVHLFHSDFDPHAAAVAVVDCAALKVWLDARWPDAGVSLADHPKVLQLARMASARVAGQTQ